MKNKITVITTLLVIVGLFLISFCRADEEAAVQLIQPEIRNVQDYVIMHGKVEDPNRKSVYAPDFSLVQKVYVSVGDRVEHGQVLMRLKRQTDRSSALAATLAADELAKQIETGDFDKAEETIEKAIQVLYRTGITDSLEEEYDLKSPCDGIVMRLDATSGEIVSAVVPCAEVSDLSKFVIFADAGEDLIGKLNEGMKCRINIPAFSVQGIPGRISKIYPYAQNRGALLGKEQNFETVVCVEPEKNNELLRPGYRAKVQVEMQNRENAVLVPYGAIKQGNDLNEYVLKLQDGVLVRQVVQTGAELTNCVEIIEGLSPYDIIAASPELTEEGVNLKIAIP